MVRKKECGWRRGEEEGKGVPSSTAACPWAHEFCQTRRAQFTTRCLLIAVLLEFAMYLLRGSIGHSIFDQPQKNLIVFWDIGFPGPVNSVPLCPSSLSFSLLSTYFHQRQTHVAEPPWGRGPLHPDANWWQFGQM